MNTLYMLGAVALLSAALGIVVGWSIERLRLKRAKATAEDEAARIRAAAEQDAERVRKSAELAGREAAYQAKEAWMRWIASSISSMSASNFSTSGIANSMHG